MKHSVTPAAAIFVLVLAMVYLSAAVIIVWWLAGLVRHWRSDRRWGSGGKRKKHSRWVRWPAYCVLALAAVGLLCMAYGYWIEPNWLSVSRITIESGKLPKGARPIRIVQISDTHCEGKPRLEPKVPRVIRDLKPDIIVFTGDAANSDEGVPVFRKLMTDLAAIAPTFAVQGNWDLDGQKLFAGTGVTELRGRSCGSVQVGAVMVQLAGLTARWGQTEVDVEPAIKRLPADGLRVLLYHFPDQAELAARSGIDLYLAGHTHGGQVSLPFYGALITLSRYGKKYESGLYHVGGTVLYVNRGLGMEGHDAPRVRFGARPEVALIEVRPPQ